MLLAHFLALRRVRTLPSFPSTSSTGIPHPDTTSLPSFPSTYIPNPDLILASPFSSHTRLSAHLLLTSYSPLAYLFHHLLLQHGLQPGRCRLD